jgi:hypothetical protein
VVAESFLDAAVYTQLKLEESTLASPTNDTSKLNHRKSRIIEPEEEMARQKRISRRSMQITTEETEKAVFFSKMMESEGGELGDETSGGLAAEFSDYFGLGFLGFCSTVTDEETPLPEVKDEVAALPERKSTNHGWSKEMMLIQDSMLESPIEKVLALLI